MAGVRWPDATAHSLKQLIARHGQPARLDIAILDDDGWEGLLAVVVAPLDGWRHLVQNVDECIAVSGPYHVSVANPAWHLRTISQLSAQSSQESRRRSRSALCRAMVVWSWEGVR